MKLEIIWSPRAEMEFADILSYINSEWNEKVVLNFINSLDGVLIQLSENPLMFPLFDKKREIRKCVLNKRVILFYRLRNENIELVSLFNTRQNPRKINL